MRTQFDSIRSVRRETTVEARGLQSCILKQMKEIWEATASVPDVVMMWVCGFLWLLLRASEFKEQNDNSYDLADHMNTGTT